MAEKESKQIIEFLSGKNVPFTVIEHTPVFTSADAATVRNAPLSAGVKAIVLKTSSLGFVLACVPGDRKIDLKKVAYVSGEKTVFLASPSEVLEKTGCEIGSVSPVCCIFGLRTFFDKNIMLNVFVEFNIGLHTMSVRMKSADLVRAVSPVIGDFAK